MQRLELRGAAGNPPKVQHDYEEISARLQVR
jgi:hypothetical protein